MASQIHATAIVEDGAVVEDGCVLGPYCHIGPHVRLGSGTVLHGHAVVDGHTVLGEACHVFPFACIGKQTQDLKFSGGVAHVEIGANTTLREYVTVNSATRAGDRTVIGCNCSILAYCHIAHDCCLGDRVIMSNCTQLAGHVSIADDVVFGGLGGVHQFVRIGRMAMISATAKVVQDIAPFCLADGSPALPVTINKIGLQRHGRSPDEIAAVSAAYKILFRAKLTLAAAQEKLQEQYGHLEDVRAMLDFVASSERGLARPKASS